MRPQVTATQLEQLIAGIARRVGSPSELIPSTRCVSRTSLHKVLADFRKSTEFNWLRKHRNDSVTTMLCDAGVATPLTSAVEIQRRDQLYALGFGVSPGALEPLEILTALEPHGVVCYFSALELHQLTTQVPPHHHIGIPVKRPIELGAPAITMTETPPPLGTIRGRYAGVDFYSTQRPETLMLGVQRRHVSSFLLSRATTVEQTLLDTLIRPYSCGGAAVIFEAWETGSSRMVPRKFVDLLKVVNQANLTQRAAWWLHRWLPGESALLAELQGYTGDEWVSALPGMPYTVRDERFHVLGP